ncbi:conserved hypothetical protein [Ricinus communis]|uniref:Uncharacterized protein n=1 Tax=Ricinus communis TaxID=3988 RepID=B9SGJ0_RICCO|nr:conserved hypothetical protein [Ricinus communis]
MSRKAFTMPSLPSLLTLFVLVSLCVFVRDGEACRKENEDDVFGGGMRPSMVKKGHRKSLVVTEYGEISAVDICSERKGGICFN